MIHIAITGDLGSGKSTVAGALCEKSGFAYLSTGSIQRAMASRLGMTTLEMNYLALTDHTIDEKIDGYLKEINNQSKPHILDSRLAWHFVPNSFKVFATVLPEVAARRVQSDTARTGEGAAESISQKSKELLERQEAENNRFKEKYRVDCRNPDNYDLIIDTSFHPVEEIAGFISRSYTLFCEKLWHQKFWASPKLFLPVKLYEESLIHQSDEICNPVEVCKNRHQLLLTRGHATLAHALRSNEYIPYKPVDGNPAPSPSVLKSWEDKFHLQYERE